jgi:hypothetical protein
LVLVAGVALLVAAACGGKREIEVHHAAAPQVNDSIYVQVINDHFSDARIYAIYESGSRYTLGLVVGKTKGQLTPILWQPRGIQFEISFIATEGLYYSDELLLEPGDVIQITIPPNIATSAFFRRR